jgi:hypothetical protein
VLFFEDKFVRSEFEQPKAGPKGKLQDTACKSLSPGQAKSKANINHEVEIPGWL